jgi:hypothetical protein
MSESDLQSAPDKIPCARHPQEQTRLRCVECETPVCPKCMVMYEVGFKCPDCAKKRPSHAEQVAGWQGLTAAGLALLAGFLYGWVHPWLMAIGMIRIYGIPVLALLLAYGLGMAAGNGIQRIIGYKLQRRLSWTVMLSALVGVMMSPFLFQVVEFFIVLLSTQDVLHSGTSASLYIFSRGIELLGAYIFIRGLARPFRR